MGTMGPSDDDEDSSSSSTSSDHRRRREKKRRKKQAKKEKKKAKKAKKHATKRRKKHAKENANKRRREEDEQAGLPQQDAGHDHPTVGPPVPRAGPPPPPDDGDGDTAVGMVGRVPVVPMSQAEAEAAAAVTRRVFEPETGRTRLVKASGEIVEEIVSQRRQQAIRYRASTTPSAAGATRTVQQYTGREKFPSEHPWYGMK